MGRFWSKLTGRQRTLFVLALVLGAALALKYANLPWQQAPLPNNIRALERNLAKRRTRLQEVQAVARVRDSELAGLRQQASSFWQIQGKAPEVAVADRFDALARKAQVNFQRVGAPECRKLDAFSHIREVVFEVRLKATMREVSRLLGEMEASRPAFHWTRCTIRAETKDGVGTVDLKGHIRALVLSPDAAKHLLGTTGMTNHG